MTLSSKGTKMSGKDNDNVKDESDEIDCTPRDVRQHLAFASLLADVQAKVLAPQPEAPPHTTQKASDRLLSVITRVLAANRREMVISRLQWIALAFTWRDDAAHGRDMPPPSIIHEVEERRDWWCHVREHLERFRKQEMQTTSKANEDSSKTAGIQIVISGSRTGATRNDEPLSPTMRSSPRPASPRLSPRASSPNPRNRVSRVPSTASSSEFGDLDAFGRRRGAGAGDPLKGSSQSSGLHRKAERRAKAVQVSRKAGPGCARDFSPEVQAASRACREVFSPSAKLAKELKAPPSPSADLSPRAPPPRSLSALSMTSGAGGAARGTGSNTLRPSSRGTTPGANLLGQVKSASVPNLVEFAGSAALKVSRSGHAPAKVIEVSKGASSGSMSGVTVPRRVKRDVGKLYGHNSPTVISKDMTGSPVSGEFSPTSSPMSSIACYEGFAEAIDDEDVDDEGERMVLSKLMRRLKTQEFSGLPPVKDVKAYGSSWPSHLLPVALSMSSKSQGSPRAKVSPKTRRGERMVTHLPESRPSHATKAKAKDADMDQTGDDSDSEPATPSTQATALPQDRHFFDSPRKLSETEVTGLVAVSEHHAASKSVAAKEIASSALRRDPEVLSTLRHNAGRMLSAVASGGSFEPSSVASEVRNAPGATFRLLPSNKESPWTLSWGCMLERDSHASPRVHTAMDAISHRKARQVGKVKALKPLDSKISSFGQDSGLHRQVRQHIAAHLKTQHGAVATREPFDTMALGSPRCALQRPLPWSLQVESLPIVGSKAADAYLEAQLEQARLPTAPRCLQAKSKSWEQEQAAPISLDISNLNLLDEEASSLLEGLRNLGTKPYGMMFLNGNPRLTDYTYLPLFKMAAQQRAITGCRPVRLDLSDANGMGEQGIKLLATEMVDDGIFCQLRNLKMDRLTLPDHLWSEALAAAIGALPYLEDLSLAAMHLGKFSQQGATSVAEMLPALASLTKLDLSANFFSYEGCSMLADSLRASMRLLSLNLSYNAGGFRHHHSPSKGRKGQLEANFNPMSLVCEAVREAHSLKVLHLAQCQLTYDEDFILEDSLRDGKTKLEDLDVSGNHLQGHMGARSLLRIAVRTPSLRSLRVSEFSQTSPIALSIGYEFSDPSTQYTLNLDYPQHRAMLRTLFARSLTEQQDPASVFHFAPRDKEFGQSLLNALQTDSPLPSSKVNAKAAAVAFGYTLPTPCDNDDVLEVLNHVTSHRKLLVNMSSFIRIGHLFINMVDEESKQILIQAMGADLCMQLDQLKFLAEVDARIRHAALEYLLPSISGLNRRDGLDVVLKSRKHGDPALSDRLPPGLQLLLFNPYSPNGHYEVNFSVPAGRRIFEQLMIVAEWERGRALEAKAADLSQCGGQECLRNVYFNGTSMAWVGRNFATPPRGVISFDYCSPFHATNQELQSSDEDIQLLMATLSSSSCSFLLKIAALRTVIHKLFVSPQQICSLLSVFPSRQELMERGELSLPRADVFVSLYPRCLNIADLLMDETYGVYSLKEMCREEVLTARTMLGRLRMFDVTRCDERQLVPTGKERRNTLSFRARMEEAKEDERMMARSLRDLSLRDDPTSLGNANKFSMDLSLFENRTCAYILCQIDRQEQGEHWDGASWSEREAQEARGTRFVVPPDWATNLPQVGLFTARFLRERDEYKEFDFRYKFAVKFCGW